MIYLQDNTNLLSLNVLAPLIPCLVTILLVLHLFFSKPSRKVYLIDFVCYKPPSNQALNKEATVNLVNRCSNFTEETFLFMKKVIDRSGIGDSTYLPPSHLRDPIDFSLGGAKEEAELVIFGAVDELLAKTKVKREDIGILVTNCSLFCVTPSLASMIVNRYKLRDNIASYSLSGMGCTAGLSAITLAKQTLQVRPNTYALVVSTETITQHMYRGNDQSMILVNCAFRLGGAAILLSNRSSDQSSAKYQLTHTVHNNTSSSDLSYNSISYEEDRDGNLGVIVTRDLVVAAIKTIRPNIATLASQVLPLSEKLRYILNRSLIYLNMVQSKPLVPDFKKALNHVLPHVGGKPVLDELQKNLGFSDVDMEPSRMTLYRFGNTSSSSVWYELAYVEAKRRIKKGDRVWQMAFGSGFDCCSVVWSAIRAVYHEETNAWTDEIDEFPMDISKIEVEPDFFN